MKRCILVILVTLVSTSFAARAQDFGGGLMWQNHASTYEEGVARGMADVVRSAGQANLLNSQAAINYEEARAALFENRKRYAETYFEMRRMNREYRDRERPRPSTEAIYRMAQAGLPARLGPSQLDPLTGEIAWPLLLTTDLFAPQRQSLEQLYAAQARGEINYHQYQQARQITESMIESLQGLVREVSPQEYANARGFLTSLRYESMLAAR